MATKDIDPTQLSTDAMAMQADWYLLRSIMGGTEAMRAAGKTFLPQYEGETDQSYKNRLARTVLTNYFEDALRNAVSLPFRKPIQVPDGLPQDMKDILKDIDMMGNNLDQFCRICLEDSTIMGYGFILVDWARNEAQNLAEQKQAGADRPYWVFIRADDVLGVYTSVVGGKEVITHFRYRELVTTLNEETFKEEVEERVRVYRPGRFEVWRKVKGRNWELADLGNMASKEPLPFVPVVPVWCGRRLGGFRVKPLFLDLAYKQVEHWQSASDQRNILSFARFPMLAVAGAQGAAEEDLVVGPSRVLTTTDVEGRWYYVEPRGHAIETGRRDLEDLKEEMRILGLQPLITRVGNITATARALDETRVHSAVEVLAMNLEDAIEIAMRYTEKWFGRDREENKPFGFRVNRDFNLSIRETAEVDSLIRARITGEISRKTFWSELKRRNVLSPDFDPDLEDKQLEQEFLSGKIPYSVSAKLPALPKAPGEAEVNDAIALRSTTGDLEAARNQAFKKGRSPIGSQASKGRPALP
jgi:hypothetical protein